MNNPLKWISEEIGKLVTWLTGAEVKLAPAISIAESLLNGLKEFDDSLLGKTVIGIFEQFVPASTGLVRALELQLPVWLIDLNWIQKEDGKTLDQQWADAQAYLATISDPDVYASQMNSLKALFLKFFGTNAGESVTIQQALTLAQPTHSASVLA